MTRDQTDSQAAADLRQPVRMHPPAAPARGMRPPTNPSVSRYRVSDELWARLKPIIDELDPPVRTSGRKRIDARGALDAIIYQMLMGCGWNKLPRVFPDDSSVHRTYQRWKRLGVLNRLWACIVEAEHVQHSRAG